MKEIIYIISVVWLTSAGAKKYSADWNILRERSCPEWYENVKIGIKLNWGIFSVPSFGGENFWQKLESSDKQIKKFMRENYPPGFKYPEFAKDFTAEFFDATEWVNLFKESGARYVIITSKNDDGYTLFPSDYSYGWNSVDVGPHRDLIGQLEKAVHKEKMGFGVSYSLTEWKNPLYLDKKNKGEYVEKKLMPEINQIIKRYKLDIFWADRALDKDDYYRSSEIIANLYNSFPSIAVNDRWGKNMKRRSGDFYSLENSVIYERHKWENIVSLDKKSHVYRRNSDSEDYLTIEELIEILATTVSNNGNLLISLGPTKEGTIIPIMQERLTQLGKWLRINGEAIYNTISCKSKKDDNTDVDIRYTSSYDKKTVYAIILKWPTKPKLNVLRLKSLLQNFPDKNKFTFTLLGNKNNLEFSLEKNDVVVTFPLKATVSSQWAWVLKIQ